MKYIKAGEEVSVKLILPKDLPWKIFGQLLRDLGANEESHKELFGVIRRRSIPDLMALLPKFEPRSILGRYTYEKSNAFSFFREHQIGAFLKKFPFKGTDTKTPAVMKFWQSEHHCKLFNTENYKAIIVLDEKHPRYFGILDEIRKDIVDLIGETPPLSSIMSYAKHGPGVSLGDQYKGGCCTSYYKYANLPYTVTASTLPLARLLIESDPRWIGALDHAYRQKFAIPIGQPIDVDLFWDYIFEIVDGSRVTTVPKTALTDRTIAIEPLLNVFIQLGVDNVLKILLRKKWGYDLSSQLRNQILALEASLTDLLVTLDLKGASDSVALMCCVLLLPPGWLDLVYDLRSPKGDLEGVTCTFEKVSSMGNGFTFALETLIFGAIVRCAIRRTNSEKKSAVYGDDIIVPTTAKDFVIDLLNLFGFELNLDKSFSSGPFRESCGKDYYLGYDVRPIFLKRQIKSVCDLFYIHNSVYALQERCHWTWEVDLSKTLQLIQNYIPKNIREQFYGPSGESLDTHLFSDTRLNIDPKTQRKVTWQITAKPKRYNFRTDFFFRKLMNTLKERPPILDAANGQPLERILTLFNLWPELRPKWDRNRKSDSGNAFDVTKRDKVQLCCTKGEIVQTIFPNLKPTYSRLTAR